MERKIAELQPQVEKEHVDDEVKVSDCLVGKTDWGISDSSEGVSIEFKERKQKCFGHLKRHDSLERKVGNERTEQQEDGGMWSATRYNERTEQQQDGGMWSATRYNKRVENRMGGCGQPPATMKG